MRDLHLGLLTNTDCGRWLPWAQMPHHHDWHHEGHKGCNYTFTALGGLWDGVFGTRKTGRCLPASSTRADQAGQAGRTTSPRQDTQT